MRVSSISNAKSWIELNEFLGRRFNLCCIPSEYSNYNLVTLVSSVICSISFHVSNTVFLLMSSWRPIFRYDCPAATSLKTFGSSLSPLIRCPGGRPNTTLAVPEKPVFSVIQLKAWHFACQQLIKIDSETGTQKRQPAQNLAQAMTCAA